MRASLSRVARVLRKDLALGPRSPVFLWAVLMPAALTLVLQGAFGSLFDPDPRLAVVDAGRSEVTAALLVTEGIEVTLLDDEATLRERVEANDVDAGLVLPAGFDDAVRAGEKPELPFVIGGESLASNRIILAVTTIDLVRSLEDGRVPVEVVVVRLGEGGLPIGTRLIPVIVFFALVMAGIFLTGSSLVEEKERGTLAAILVTPARVGEVLAAKWSMGLGLAAVMAFVTLALNGAVGGNWPGLVVVVLVAAALAAVLGLLLGVGARNSTMMFGIVKGLGLFLFAPALFYIFPEWPQWIAMLFPLYWIIEPIWQVAVMGEGLGAVVGELAVALGLTAALGAAAIILARRLPSQLAGA